MDHEQIKVRMFSQILVGEGNRWFTSLPDSSILCYQALDDGFKERWAEKRHPRRFLAQFYSIRREESESVPEFYDGFVKVYNSIHSEFKPPHGTTELQYVESFDSKFSLWLSERRSVSLEDMIDDAMVVEINLTVAREKEKEEEEERTKTSPSFFPLTCHRPG